MLGDKSRMWVHFRSVSPMCTLDSSQLRIVLLVQVYIRLDLYSHTLYFIDWVTLELTIKFRSFYYFETFMPTKELLDYYYFVSKLYTE